MLCKRKICVVTGSRAEYGLLNQLLKEIKEDTNLELQLIVTGMHLSPEFGLTYKEIEQDGFKIDKKVESLLSSDSPTAISKSIGLGIIGFSDVFNSLNPDIIVLLGDRFEIFAAAQAAMISRIKIAHLYGGEVTEGAFDDAIRHSITKMSDIHFVANKEYKNRIIQLGENKEYIFDVGTCGLDALYSLKLLSKNEIEKKLNFKFQKINFLVTFHPITLNSEETNFKAIQELLKALEHFHEANIIFTKSNADTYSRIINDEIENFVNKNNNYRFCYTNLGHTLYLSLMKNVNAVIGNSSSGLTEAPAINIPSVNIGDRQKGRSKADSVINCIEDKYNILEAILKALDEQFLNKINSSKLPYGKGGGVSKNIKNVLKNIDIASISKKKKFFDIIFE